MALTVADILTRALVLMQDEGAVRWKPTELIGWLNEGIRATISMKPDVAAQRTTIALAAGVDQDVPATMDRIARFVGNTNGAAVTPTTRMLMDAYVPQWRSTAVMGSHAAVKHVLTDESDQRTFQVTPPNDGTGSLDVIAVMRPTVIAVASPNPDTVSSYTGVDCPFEGVEGDALVDYLVFRACTKDTDLPGMATRAQAALQQFMTRLGIEAQAEQKIRPEQPAQDPAI